MNFVQSNLAREAGRLVRWRERFWGRRYQAIPVSDEPDAQLSRLRYILSQGCKEGIVSRPEHWRGAHCVRELISGTATLHGEWVDRTAMYRAGGHADSAAKSKFTTSEVLDLSPLPCFEGAGDREQRTWIGRCIEEIVARARLERRGHRSKRRGRRCSKQDVETTQALKRSRAPWFHVSSAAAGLHGVHRHVSRCSRETQTWTERDVSGGILPAGAAVRSSVSSSSQSCVRPYRVA
jgi:hypothetical protein